MAKQQAARLRGAPRRFVSEEVVKLEGKVGQEIPVIYTAGEIAKLVDSRPAAIEGARVCIKMPLSGEEVCVPVKDGKAKAALTLNRPHSRTLAATVDLTTAEGHFGGAIVSEWTVQPALRLVDPKPGAPQKIGLSTPASVASGAPATLTAILYDKRGQRVPRAGQVDFVDVRGEVIGTAEMTGGVAKIQYIPKPTTPRLDKLEPVTLENDSGAQFQGFAIKGTGFSQEVELFVDGKRVVTENPSGNQLHYYKDFRSPELLWIAVVQKVHDAPLNPGPHTVRVVNPAQRDDRRSLRLEDY